MPVTLAGSRLKLTTQDLQELLKEAETEGAANLNFFYPQQEEPLKAKFTAKGRGQALGFQRGALPSVEYSGSANQVRDILNLGAPVGESVKVETEETKPELKKFEGEVGEVSIRDIGQQGFGMKDYNIAVAAGYDTESIKDWVTANKSSLYNIGPEAQKQLGIEGYVSTTPGVFDYTEYGQSGFGMKDVEALREKGVPQETMKTLAAQAPKVGPEAARQLDYTPSAQQFLNATLENFDYGAAGQAGFGMEDVKSLMAQGATTEQMRELAKRAPGGQIGPAARELLGL